MSKGFAFTVLLLAPQPPMPFMGEEFAATQPFFCDFGADLANAVAEGWRREFARCELFAENGPLPAWSVTWYSDAAAERNAP